LEINFFKIAAQQQFKDRKNKFHDSRRRMATSKANKQAMNSLALSLSLKTKSRNQDIPLGHNIVLPYLEYAAVTFETRHI
jgi:hypothetical protein